MAEHHMDREEQKRAEEWEEYLAWHEAERQLNELKEKQDVNQQDSTSVH
jgi:hypothetical protein